VLEPVVGEEHVAARIRREQRTRGRRPIAADPHRMPGRREYRRLVADRHGVVVGRDRARSALVPP